MTICRQHVEIVCCRPLSGCYDNQQIAKVTANRETVFDNVPANSLRIVLFVLTQC